MKHEHTLEIKVPEKVEQVQTHIRTNKQSYLFGLGGLVLGVVGTRLLSKPLKVEIIVNNV